MQYDKDNIFAKILMGKIPTKKVLENHNVLAFMDAEPLKKVHALVIPKGSYTSLTDFADNATTTEKAAILDAVVAVAKKLNVIDSGYRVITNVGKDAGQEIKHLHFHVLAGELLGPMSS